MSGSDDPKPPRTLLGHEHSGLDSTTDPDLPSVAPIAEGLDSTLPMGGAGLRKELEATLAAGPAAAAAKLAAARAAAVEPNPASTMPMGSKAIANAAEPAPSSPKGPLAFTAKGTPPSTHELAEAIAKAAAAHAERTKTPTGPPQGSPVGVVHHDYADPSSRKQTTPGAPGSDPAIRATTPVPGANPAMANLRPSDPAIGRTPSANLRPSDPAIAHAPSPSDPVIARTPTPSSLGYGSPSFSNPAVTPPNAPAYTNPAATPPTYANPAPASNPAVAPTTGYGSNPAVTPLAVTPPATGYASSPATHMPGYGSPATPSPSTNVVSPLGYGSPNNPAVARAPSTELPQDSMFARPKSPTGPNPNTPSAFAPGSPNPNTPAGAPGYAEPSRRPAFGQTAPSPLAISTAQGFSPVANVDPSRAKPPTGPNPAVDPSAFAPKPGSSPGAAAYDPNAYGAKASTAYDPTAYGLPAPAYDPSRAKPPTGPSPAVDPTAYAHGSAGYDPRNKPPTGPNPAIDPYPQPASYDPSRAKPPTGPNPAVDPNAFAQKPGSSPGAAAYGAKPNTAYDPTAYGLPAPDFKTAVPMAVAPADRTMLASPESQAGQLSPAADRPRVSTDPMKPIAETLREVPVENYEIKAEIARGGMGRILRANDLRLHRQVAIKELLGDHASFKARFERETLITARLQHPAIVPIYDAGRWPTGELFYTMKLVAGKPLETLIDNVGGMAERLRYLPNMIAVAEALAYAHSNNVVHRDLKPANILIGDFGETIVIDWGLAKDFSTNETAEPAGPFRSPAVGHMGATVAGSVMGTPAYMPLEQGRGQQVDARADVYAIGAVLYHVLSKRAPYEGPDGMSILQQLLKEPPRPLTELAPDVPPELATIVAKAMAREPDGRYPTCRELVDDLRRYQNGQMVGVHRYTSRELFKRWAKRHKGALAVAALSFVVLVVVGVIAISNVVSANREAQRERDIALDKSKAALEAQDAAQRSEARAKLSEAQAAIDRDKQKFVRERRVEFDHFAHTKLSKCSDCHPTDPKTFTALPGTPGHAQCEGCHDPKSMTPLSNDPKCAFCHTDRVATTKDHSSLRACDDGSVRALKSAGGKTAPCFKHDLKQHRFADDGKPLECTVCHAMLADQSKWGSRRYQSLQDLDAHTIIGQGPGGGIEAMHKACSTGCHAHEQQTGLVRGGTTNCTLCHPSRRMSTF